MRAIPLRLLCHSAVLAVPAGVTLWAAPTGDAEAALSRVHIQRQSETRLTGGDTDVQPLIELYYDARLSLPHGLNFARLKRDAEAVGGALRVTYDGAEYTVRVVDELLDGAGRVHHYRLEMR